MAKKLDFKDFLTVDYAPGMPDLIKKNAKKRKMDSGAGTNAEYSSRYSPEDKIDTIGEKTANPIELGTHAKNVGMGYTGKHKTIKDPGSKKGRHTHVFQFTGEEAELDEAFKVGDKVTYQKSKRERGNAVISSISAAKKNHFYIKTEKEGTIMVPGGELELAEETELDEVSRALAHKVAKARQAQASDLRQKAVDEPDMMKAFTHTKAANKAEKKAGQSYNRLMRKEEVQLDEYNTKSSKAIVTKDNKPIAIYPDLKSAQNDYHGKNGYAIGTRSHSAAMRIKKENPGIKIVESTEEVDEALTLQQRRARGRKMKLKRRQIEVGRKRALKRAADPKRLKTRAEKAARNAIFRRLAKGKSRDEVPPQRKQEIEKRMEKMRTRIQRLAIKLLPKVRQIDKERRATKQEQEDK